jgi:hypothetical protein
VKLHSHYDLGWLFTSSDSSSRTIWRASGLTRASDICGRGWSLLRQ